MTFAVEKDKTSSERIPLIRLTFKTDISSDASVVSGFLNQISNVTKKPQTMSVIVSNNALNPALEEIFHTEVFSYPPATREWYYDASVSKVFYGGESFSSAKYLTFREYLTTNLIRYAPETPTTPGDVTAWHPLLTSSPQVTQSIEDFTIGILSTSSSELELINESNWLGKYTGQKGSISGQEVKIWYAINDLSNAKLVFTGTMVSFTQSKEIASIRILDQLSKLNQPATFQKDISKITAKNIPAVSQTVTPKDDGKNFPRHLARRTNYSFGTNVGTIASTSDFYQGICIDYNPNLSTTVNRKWVCGLVKKDLSTLTNDLGTQTQGFGNVNATIADGLLRYFDVASPSNLYYGQGCRWFASAAIRFGVIVRVGTFTHMSVNYNLAVIPQNGNFGDTGNIFSTQRALSLYLKSGTETANLINFRDYTTAIDVATGRVEVILTDNFEANFPTQFPAISPHLNPEVDQLSYYYHVAGDITHGNVIRSLLEAAGLVVNAASITSANSSLAVDVCFSIPYGTSGGQASAYADYVGDLLASTGGYLYINDANEVEYRLFTFPAPIAANYIYPTEYWDLNISVEYQDVSDEVKGVNDHYRDNKLTSSVSPATLPSSITVQNRQVLALNGLAKTRFINYTTESMANSIATVSRLSSNRRSRISFKTATKLIDARPGDDIRVFSDNLPGGVASVDLKIVSKSTNGIETSIEAIEIYDY